MLKMHGALAGVAQWIECQPVSQKVTGLIPSQDTCMFVDQVPSWGHARGNRLMCLSHIDVSLPLFLPPSPKNKIFKKTFLNAWK